MIGRECVRDVLQQIDSQSYDTIGRVEGWEDALLDRLDAIDRCGRVMAHIEALPRSIRAIARMRFVDGWTITQISSLSGIPRSTVHRRVWDAARLIGDMETSDDPYERCG